MPGLLVDAEVIGDVLLSVVRAIVRISPDCTGSAVSDAACGVLAELEPVEIGVRGHKVRRSG